MVTVLAWTKQNTMQRAMRTVLEWPQSPATSKTINMITNKYEPQQKCRLETVRKKLLAGLNRFYGYPTSHSASVMDQNIQLFGPHEGFLTHQWIITGNKKKITDKYYDEIEMRTRQKRVATDTWRSLGCRATH